MDYGMSLMRLNLTGVAEAFHENGKLRSSTKIKDGKAYGLIREWDENGTSIGPRFKDEF